MTTRGAATKARIVDAADQLMYERGVASTTLADVRAASETSKSQLYQHFAGKRALVLAVVEVRADAVLSVSFRRRLHDVRSALQCNSEFSSTRPALSSERCDP
ncbi:hypothetical protein CH266_00535 [Rhodococcus sp. 06-1474-1B]|nr:hypothetical protein CH267_10775 [Rhodococcus sp. 06-621-2]OZD55913.1 hypothetical protein CH266_00535 [Rhodococcus sp. 06-1474-1B]OZF42522.1 hypothetical protein CH291_25870 [Rhodococcus sp. 14-1411-2a]